ncbi:MAG: metal-dependent hydrolase [Pirellulaceae bacterium]|nr:metal-dependent hydrolase [Pirellulaceae bacterium]
MADFKTHIATSSVVGAGYGIAGYALLGAPSTCVLSAGLCGLAGTLPDLDSDSGVPVRETMTFASAVVPMLMIDRFQTMGWSHETIVLAGGILYLGVRFGVGALIKRYTIHRGMWHSLPAAAIFGLLAFLICSCDDTTLRLFKTGAVVLGFMVHLILDELWAVDLKKLRLKKSFGTAMKLWGNNRWGNVSVYAKLGFLVLLAIGDPIIMERIGIDDHGVPHVARELLVPPSTDAPSTTRDDNRGETTGTPFDPWDAIPTFKR